MTTSIQELILKRILEKELGAFTASDFLDIAKHDAVRKALDRLEDVGKIRRVIRGVYDKPKFNIRFNMFEVPKIEEIASAIARQYNWYICPSGNFALNKLGLSMQVPAQYIFVSNGPYCSYMVEGTKLIFKHTTSREITSFSYITQLVIQAIKAIGRENIVTDDVAHLSKTLSLQDKKILKEEGKKTSIWIYEIIKEICEG
ncbi:MAG: type IV toxin-antitoxin system AbiEi family antitoxin domain-containing protein [Clostridia bacterium]|nr:type IV toxin-antitoxin system AbiEi family antitoxin domain-containing protein [Clostridia bacterium]